MYIIYVIIMTQFGKTTLVAHNKFEQINAYLQTLAI